MKPFCEREARQLEVIFHIHFAHCAGEARETGRCESVVSPEFNHRAKFHRAGSSNTAIVQCRKRKFLESDIVFHYYSVKHELKRGKGHGLEVVIVVHQHGAPQGFQQGCRYGFQPSHVPDYKISRIDERIK